MDENCSPAQGGTAYSRSACVAFDETSKSGSAITNEECTQVIFLQLPDIELSGGIGPSFTQELAGIMR